MATVEEVRNYVGASISDTDFITTCLDTAVSLVEDYVGTSEVRNNVLDIAYTQVASELFHRRNAPNGIAQFASMDGTAMRVSRDPLTSTYPLLNRYVLGGV
jgi:hypothetical protein